MLPRSVRANKHTVDLLLLPGPFRYNAKPLLRPSLQPIAISASQSLPLHTRVNQFCLYYLLSHKLFPKHHLLKLYVFDHDISQTSGQHHIEVRVVFGVKEHVWNVIPRKKGVTCLLPGDGNWEGRATISRCT
jgi:hypothetical protein